jgi:hypothetical protein
MTTNAFRRLCIAALLSVSAAAVHGLWFAETRAASAGPNDAQIRVMTWDEYERIWVGVMIAAPTVDGPFVVRSSEGSIIELRPRAAGDTIDSGSLPAALFDVLTPTDLADASIPQPADLPNDNNGTPLPALLAEGQRVFARLKVSRPDTISEARPVLEEGEVWAGPLNPTPADVEAADVDGSVGVHAVQLTTNSGVDTINFTWDIGRWAKGDIMLGVNNGTYKILDKEGEFKRFLGSADYGMDFEGDALNEFTTGCAANWRTGEFYATNFDFNQPAVNIFSRHPGTLSDTGYLRPYANSTRRVSTIARRASEPVDGSPIDKAPETVLFDAEMNMYVGHSFGYFGPPPTVDVDGVLEPAPGWEDFAVLQDYDDDGEFFPAYYEWGVNGVPIAWNDGGGALIVDETGALFNVKRLDVDEEYWEPAYGFTSGQLLHNGNALAPFTTIFGSELAAPLTVPQAFLANGEDGDWLEREEAPGQLIPWQWPLGKRLHRYNNVSADPLGAPSFSTAARDIFWTFTGQQGTDAIDMAVDNVLYYTSEDTYIHRYDPINGVQLPDFGLGKLRMRNEDRVRRFGGIRLLPPGDGSGGLLVVGGDGVFRFDEAGNYIQEYQVLDDPDLLVEGDPDTGLQLNFYTLEVDPGGRTFWVIPNFTSGWLYQFDIASGRELKRLKAVDYLDPDVDPEMPAGRRMEAVCIMWEYTAVQEICGNGLDDDGDGLIDESCSPIESCSVESPGDDDGDGLVDNNDPDCGLELPPVAVDDSYIINQGATLTIAPEASNQVMSNDSDPDNSDEDNPLRFDELLVTLVGTSGTPATAAGQSVATTAGGSVTLEADGSMVYTPLPDFHGTDTFVYLINDGVANSNVATVTIVVKPFAANDAYQVPEGLSVDIAGLQTTPAGILVNDSNQPLTVIAAGRNGVQPMGASPSMTFTTLFNGVVTVYANGRFTYVAPANYLGADWFDYQAHDGVSATNIARVMFTIEDVNSVVATNDGTYTIAYNGGTVQNLLLNDSDPEGDPFHITHIDGVPVSVGQTVSITNGSVRLENANGSVSIFPATGYSGPLSFTYSVVDEPEADEPATASATVFAEVGAQPIVPQDDYYMTQQNTPLHVPTFPWETLLANDPGNPPAVLAFTEKGGGTVQLNGSPATGLTPYEGTVTVYPDGSLDYTPKTNFVGIDSFRYIVSDGLGGTVWANAIITVTPTSSTVTVTTPDPSIYGTSAMVSATVTCGDSLAPSVGYVTFRLGANVLAAYVPVVNGVATATLPATLPVGSYVVMAEYTGSSQQPTVCPGSFDADSHNVAPKPARVIADNQTKVYGTLFTFNGSEFTTDGFLFEDVVSGAALASLTGAPVTATVPGGPYPVSVSSAVGVGLENYSISYEPGALIVTPAPLQVQAHDKTRQEGTPNPVLDGVWTGLLNGDVITAAYSTTAGLASPAGQYPITPTPSDPNGRLANYVLTIVPGTLVVTPAPANNPPVAADDSRTTEGTTPVAITVLVNDSDPDGDGINVVPTGYTQPANGTVSLTGNVFTFVADPGFSGTTTFTYTIVDTRGATASATVTIVVTLPACVTEPAPAVALVRQNSTFDGRLEGSIQLMTAVNVNLNSTAVITGQLRMLGTPAVTINGTPGSYGGAVNGTGAASPTNHRVTINSGAILGQLVRRTDAVSLPTVALPPTTTGTRYVTMNNAGDNPGSFTTIRNLTLNSNVGPVAVPACTYDTFTANSNTAFVLGVPGSSTPVEYNFQRLTLNSGSSLKIVGPVVITLRYGTAFNGPVGHNEHPEWLTFRVAAGDLTLNSNVPMWGYVEVPSGRVTINSGSRLKGGLAADKLTINSNGVLELVEEAPQPCSRDIVVTIDSHTKVYGDPDPTLTYQVTGGGPVDPGVLSGAVARQPGSSIGQYALTQGTIAAANGYTLTVIPGTLTIVPRPATVTGGNGSKVFGSADPALSTVTTTGFLSADQSAVTLNQSRTAGEAVGFYPVTPTASGAVLANYAVTYFNGQFEILKAPSSTTVTGGTYAYNGQPKPQTCSVTGANGAVLTGGQISYTPGPGAPTNVGTYAVSCSFAGDANHLGSSGSNTVVIEPKAATITAGNASKTYGASDPSLTAASTSGFAPVDLLGLVITQQRAAGETVGSYTTTAQAVGLGLLNYAVTYVNGNFTITKAPLTITANNKTKVQGAANPVLDGTISGVVNGDAITAAYATTATTTSPVGQYPITSAAVDPNGRLGNYTVTLVPGTLTVTSSACDVNGYTTYSQGGWGSKPNGNNPGALLAANFADVYPNGLTLGGDKTLKFTSAYAIERYLPAGGSPSVLTSSYVNPTSSKGGTLSAQLLAVQLAVDFSDAGVLKAGLGDLVFVSGAAAGQSLRDVLAMANTVFGGQTSALPSGMSLSGLASLLESVVNNFHEGTVNQGLLGCGDGTRPCAAAEFVFNQSSSGSGPAGNVRQFSNNNVPVKVSAFSRDRSNGNWAAAFLGAFGSYGMGVTDTSESGSGDTHTIDNSGRDNYMVFVFDRPVVASKAYLGWVSGDSDAQMWIGTVNNAFNSGVTLSDAVLSGFGSPETSNGGSSARWITFNGSAKAGNVIVIAASTSSSNDKFKVAKLETSCATPPPPPCVPPVAGNDSRSAISATPLMMQVLSNDTDPNGEDLTIVPGGFTQPANGTVTLSGNTFTFTSNAGFTGTTSFTYRVRNESGCDDTATVTITVTAPEPVCQVSTLTFSQSSSSNGSAGNVRTFSANGVSVKVSAFSRDKNKNKWSTAYLGAFGSYGMGVTDSSESGNGATHTVDNSGRNNYMVFAFDEPVIVTKAFLGYVYDDSDAMVWVGTINNAYSSVSLSDSVLASLGNPESSSGSSSTRWVTFNGQERTGNVVVIAANTSQSDDAFKVAKLEFTRCSVNQPDEPWDHDHDDVDCRNGSHDRDGDWDRDGRWGRDRDDDRDDRGGRDRDDRGGRDRDDDDRRGGDDDRRGGREDDDRGRGGRDDDRGNDAWDWLWDLVASWSR